MNFFPSANLEFHPIMMKPSAVQSGNILKGTSSELVFRLLSKDVLSCAARLELVLSLGLCMCVLEVTSLHGHNELDMTHFSDRKASLPSAR